MLATWSERLSGELLYPSRYRHGYLNGTRSGHLSKRILHRDETVPVILRIGALGRSLILWRMGCTRRQPTFQNTAVARGDSE